MAVNGYEMVLTGYIANQMVQNVFHVEGDEVSPANAYVRAMLIAGEYVGAGAPITLFIAALPAGYLASSLRVRRVYPTGGPTAIVLSNIFTEPAGQRAGEISSLQANPLIIWIPATDPTKTGRQFLPGVSETDIANMVLTAGLIADIEAFIAAFNGAVPVGGDDYVGAIYRRAQVGPPPVAHLMDRIDQGYISPLIGTQRRRLRPV